MADPFEQKKWILKNFTGKNCKNEHIAERIVKSYRCPKIGGDAKQTLEIRVERKRNLKLGEFGEVSFRIYKLGELDEVSFGMLKLGELGEVSFRKYKLGELGK